MAWHGTMKVKDGSALWLCYIQDYVETQAHLFAAPTWSGVEVFHIINRCPLFAISYHSMFAVAPSSAEDVDEVDVVESYKYRFGRQYTPTHASQSREHADERDGD